jgi:hypothetical protein
MIAKETNIYNNQIIYSPYSGGSGNYGIEATRQSYFQIYDNYIEGAGYCGIAVGAPWSSGRDWIHEYGVVRNNAVINTYYFGIMVDGLGSKWDDHDNTGRYIDIHHNVVDGYSETESGGTGHRTLRGIFLNNLSGEEYSGAVGYLDYVRIRNNTVQDVTGYAVYETGSPTNITCEYNGFNDNTYDSYYGGSCSNTVTSDPGYVLEEDPDGYIPGDNHIDAGVVISSVYVGDAPSYNGSAPDIGWYETGESYEAPNTGFDQVTGTWTGTIN